jgi:hypothetical protein
MTISGGLGCFGQHRGVQRQRERLVGGRAPRQPQGDLALAHRLSARERAIGGAVGVLVVGRQRRRDGVVEARHGQLDAFRRIVCCMVSVEQHHHPRGIADADGGDDDHFAPVDGDDAVKTRRERLVVDALQRRQRQAEARGQGCDPQRHCCISMGALSR